MIKEKTKTGKQKVVILGIVLVIVLLVAVSVMAYVKALFGFSREGIISVELEKNSGPGKRETIILTDKEEIAEIYDAIRYTTIEKLKLCRINGLEGDSDWTIILHYSNEELYFYMGTEMVEEIYFRRYYGSECKFHEIYLDDSKMRTILQKYE